MKSLLKGKKIQTFPCLNIYPKSLGGVKYEDMPAVDPDADMWQKAENRKFYYLNVWDKETKRLVPYHPLPDVVTVSADLMARMLSCPYIKLKQLKTSVWGKVQGWIPVIVLMASILFLLIIGGE